MPSTHFVQHVKGIFPFNIQQHYYWLKTIFHPPYETTEDQMWLNYVTPESYNPKDWNVDQKTLIK